MPAQTPADPLPAQHRAMARRPHTLVIWALIAFGWCQLFIETLGIRAANLDDLNFQELVTRGAMGQYIHDWGPVQGRYYGWFAFAPIWAIDSIYPQWLYQFCRLGLVAVMVGLMALLARRVTGSATLALLFLLVWIACLQIAPSFYGLISYPALHCGMIFTLIGALLFWEGLESSAGMPRACLAAAFFFLGIHFNEAFLSFIALFLGLLFWHARLSGKPVRLGLIAPFVLACAVYLAIYAVYRRGHPPQYEGTVAGTDLAGVLVYLSRYSASSLPGFELVIDRNLFHPAFLSSHEIIARLQTVNPWCLPWVGAAAVATYLILSRDEGAFSRKAGLIVGIGFAVEGLLFLAMPAVSAKYQIYAYRRGYPHAYNFIFVCFEWLAFATLALALARRFARNSPGRRWVAVAFAALIALSSFLVQVSNPISIGQIQETIARRSELPAP